MTVIDLPDGTYTAVVDAIEDGLATVFFEQDDEEKGKCSDRRENTTRIGSARRCDPLGYYRGWNNRDGNVSARGDSRSTKQSTGSVRFVV